MAGAFVFDETRMLTAGATKILFLRFSSCSRNLPGYESAQPRKLSRCKLCRFTADLGWDRLDAKYITGAERPRNEQTKSIPRGEIGGQCLNPI